MTEPFVASSISADLVASNNGLSRAEMHGMMFLARYPNERTRQGYALTLKQWFRWCAQVHLDPLEARRNHLEQTIGDRTTGPIFTTRAGNRIDRRVVGRLINSICIDIGITKRVTPHSFRHAYVTLSLEAGRSERDVAASVGHKDTRLVAYYDRGRDRMERNTTYSVAALIEGAM